MSTDALKSRYAFPDEPMNFNEDEVHRLLVHLSTIGASDTKLQGNGAIIAKVHGVNHRLTNRVLPPKEVEEIVNCLYGPNGAARISSGSPVNATYELKRKPDRFRYRFNAVSGLKNGQKSIEITVRTLVIDPPTIAQAGLDPYILNGAFPKDGIFLVVGSTGSGKSTTLSAMVRAMLEDPTGNRYIVTNEAPIEYVYDTVNCHTNTIFQSSVGDDGDFLNFNDALKEAMRRAPDVILNGEIRDFETVQATLAAAQSGHAVYSTLHAFSTDEVFRRIAGWFDPKVRPAIISSLLSSIRGICWQTLIPTKDGKRAPLREALIFTSDIRTELMSIGADNMEAMLVHMRKLIEQHGITKMASGQRLFDEGKIDEEGLILVSAYAQS